MHTKLNDEYVWILHLKDHFSKFSILYALKSNKALEIAYYIGFFMCDWDMLEILQYNNSQRFKGTLLMFLKKYNIKLINSHPCTPCIQGLVKQTNIVVKDKFWK